MGRDLYQSSADGRQLHRELAACFRIGKRLPFSIPFRVVLNFHTAEPDAGFGGDVAIWRSQEHHLCPSFGETRFQHNASRSTERTMLAIDECHTIFAVA